MEKTCIVTGGAGFIGCAISKGLAQQFDRVIAIDMLHPQIHLEKKRPAALYDSVKLEIADVCDPGTWDRILPQVDQMDTIIHLAAETGTGQSLEEATRHAMTNVVGMTQMLDALVRHKKIPSQIILTSSRAVYGEGLWKRDDGTLYYPGQRSNAQLKAMQWDFPESEYVPACSSATQPHPTSIYGCTKLAQENLLASWALSFGVQKKILRLQNVYGAGQSLINPYTGIVSLFVRMAKSGQSIPLYEDGEIIRDFVYIDDVADAILLTIENEQAKETIFDIGTGKMTTIQRMAQIISERYHAPAPKVCSKYRNGDVRHACCDMTQTMNGLHFTPRISIEDGLGLLCKWIDAQMHE